MNPYYSIFLNIRNKKCVVIGGGQVAFRKVSELLIHAANVTVISPRICSDLENLAKMGQIQIIRRSYCTGDIKQNHLAIIATGDSKLNKRAADEARLNKVLVNVVDDADISDFIVPSVLHRGDISIAVSTAGKSPALARKIRTELEHQFAVEYAMLADLIHDIRNELHRSGIKVPGNKWQDGIDLDILIKLLKKGKQAEARTCIMDKITKTTGKKKI